MSEPVGSGNVTEQTSRRAGRPVQEGIAIIGMSCLFPGAPNVDAFWQNILGKVDSVSDPPPEAWDLDVYYDPEFTDTDKVYCKRGGYLGSLVSFDPLAHGIPPVTVGGEPDQWLALQVARDAMADAGCAELPEETRRRAAIILGKGTYLNGGNAIAVERGLVVGQTIEIIKQLHPEYSGEQLELLRSEMKKALPPIGPETVSGLIPNIIVGRIANRLDLMGPAYTVDAACASSLVAIQHAMRDLQDGECDVVLAGGSQVWMPVPTLNVFCQLGALSRRGEIRPFDKDADGTLLGEGIGMVVLKRLADAERDGNRIYAVIRGAGVASDGRGMSVMAPRVDGEELALRRAYAAAGVSPRTIGLIEAHGTATPVGDVAEVQALARVFGARDGELPWCALGTVKSMISHTIPAAGVAGLIKASLALYHKVLPPTLNCAEPNPKLELEKTPFYINTETRPWIHGDSGPRRAGVNAFGFGGINSHVILEEYEDGRLQEVAGQPHGVAPAGLAHLPDWESEVFVLRGVSPAALAREIDRLADFVDSASASVTGSAGLKELAYFVNCSGFSTDREVRLAIVAHSIADLGKKLTHAKQRLADPDCRQIKDRSGIYYFAEPLAREGKIAVMLPGEGSQYPNMLADLCLNFPEARAWFDQMDRVFCDHPRGYRLSDCVFPRPSFSEEERRWAETRLMQMDVAIEAVLTANRAVLAILEGLGLEPDVYVGHSTGEYSALLASGILDLDDEESLVNFSRALNRIYHESASEDGVPRAMLLAIGAERERAEAIAREAGGPIYLAMDNCLHQAVLVGEREAATRALEIISREGLIYEKLDFDRAYHTPLFAPYGEQLRQVIEEVPIRQARTPAYCGATTKPYPDDPARIRQLIVEHGSSPVHFRDTIEGLYSEGVRVFVEAGPRGNLSAFVDDILRGKSSCVVPANVQRRSGITQLNHLVGILMAQGVDLDLAYLYEHRQPRKISWDDANREARAPSGPRIELATRWPMLRLAPEAAIQLRPEETGALGQAQVPVAPDEASTNIEPPAPVTRPEPHEQPLPALESDGINPVAELPIEVDDFSTNPDDVMSAYLDTMDQFLGLVEEVTQTYLSNPESAPLPPEPGVVSPELGATLRDGANASRVMPVQPFADRELAFPFLGTVVSWLPGEELVTRRTFDLNEDRYLSDHTFGREISTLDPDLRALAVMPLTMSLEILAEAAAVLVPGLNVVGLREVCAYHWLAWDDQPQTLEVVAERLPANGPYERVRVKLRNLPSGDADTGSQAGPAVEAVVLLAEAFAAAPIPQATHLPDGRPSRWLEDQLYTEVMFHGSSWQGVASVDETGASGAVATLRVLPTAGFFNSNPHAEFIVDPVVLDAAGQVVGFWTAEQLASGKIIFPFRLSALDIYGSAPPIGDDVTCVAAIELVGEHQVRSDIDLIGPDGQLWMRLVGWEDKRFDLPTALEPLMVSTDTTELSQAWSEPIAAFPTGSRFQCRRMSAAFPSDRGFWKQVWAQRILGRAEREQFRQLRTPEHRQLEWLAGRTAAKEAIQDLVRAEFGLELLPADIEIHPDERGQPHVRGNWLHAVDRVPVLSLAHSQGEAVALAALAPAGKTHNLKVGIDLESASRSSDFAEAAFTKDEMELVRRLPPEQDNWMLHLWCAKEAVAKALGHGMVDGPGSVLIVAFDPVHGLAVAKLNGSLAENYPDVATEQLVIHTRRCGNLVVAATCGEVMPVEVMQRRSGR